MIGCLLLLALPHSCGCTPLFFPHSVSCLSTLPLIRSANGYPVSASALDTLYVSNFVFIYFSFVFRFFIFRKYLPFDSSLIFFFRSFYIAFLGQNNYSRKEYYYFVFFSNDNLRLFSVIPSFPLYLNEFV